MADICVETSVLVGGIVLSAVVCCTEDVVCDDMMCIGTWLWHCDPWEP